MPVPGDVYSLKDGLIEPCSMSPIGFTSDVFTGTLFKRGRDIWICLVSVYPSQQNRGNFTRLLGILMDAGYRVRVACPSKQMIEILERRGFRMTGATCSGGTCPYMEQPEPRTCYEKAKQNSTFIEALYGCKNSNNIIDDPVGCIEIKSCQEFVKTTCSNGPRRYGRFIFRPDQHDELIRREGKYRLVVHDGTCRILHQILVEALEVDHLIRPGFQRKWTYFFPGVTTGSRPAGSPREAVCTP